MTVNNIQYQNSTYSDWLRVCIWGRERELHERRKGGGLHTTKSALQDTLRVASVPWVTLLCKERRNMFSMLIQDE